MQGEIFGPFGKNLLTPGLAKFGALYKRTKYEWERETRLLFNWRFYQTELSKNSFAIQLIGSKKFLKISFDNNLFTLTLKSITIGKNLEPTQKKVKNIANLKGINTIDE